MKNGKSLGMDDIKPEALNNMKSDEDSTLWKFSKTVRHRKTILKDTCVQIKGMTLETKQEHLCSILKAY